MDFLYVYLYAHHYVLNIRAHHDFSLQGLQDKMRENLGDFQRDFSYYECFFPKYCMSPSLQKANMRLNNLKDDVIKMFGLKYIKLHRSNFTNIRVPHL